MSQNCNFIIRENKNLITNFEEKFEKEVLHHKNNPALDYGEDEGFLYVNAKYSKLYIQINETIILLDIDKCTIIEKPILIKQLHELYRLFFDYLENSEYKSDYWKLFEWQEQEIFEYKHSFIDPKEFNAEFVSEFLNKLTKNDLAISVTPESTKTQNSFIKKTWFEVGFQFANGKIYDLIKEKLSHEQIAGTLFKSGRIKIDSYRTWISCSLGKVEKENQNKSIFLRPNANKELNTVISYCKEKNITISEKFKKQCNENGIILN